MQHAVVHALVCLLRTFVSCWFQGYPPILLVKPGLSGKRLKLEVLIYLHSHSVNSTVSRNGGLAQCFAGAEQLWTVLKRWFLSRCWSVTSLLYLDFISSRGVPETLAHSSQTALQKEKHRQEMHHET